MAFGTNAASFCLLVELLVHLVGGDDAVVHVGVDVN
jgi:hypothetical protein